MINEKTRNAIKGYLEGFIDGLIEQHRPEIRRAMVREARAAYSSPRGILKPFHEAIIPPEILRISAFERSFSTRLGTTFEECARLIALQTYEVAERGYVASGKMPAAAAAKIEEIITRINEGQTPNFPALIAEVLQISDDEWVERPAIADLYLRDKAGHEYFFEIKSPVPNKGQCLEVTERLLRIHAITQKNRPYVNAYFAMAYNPFPMVRAWKTTAIVSAYSIWICRIRYSWVQISGRWLAVRERMKNCWRYTERWGEKRAKR